MAIFVNGKPVYVEGTRHFDATLDRNKAEDVSLAKGWNTVLVAVTAMDRDLVFCLRIRDEHGHEPPAGLWYSTALRGGQ
jgi:hypothetical protein